MHLNFPYRYIAYTYLKNKIKVKSIHWLSHTTQTTLYANTTEGYDSKNNRVVISNVNSMNKLPGRMMI